MDDLVRASRKTIAKGSESFAAAARLFDPQTRDRVSMLYAWCRHCDDVIDGQTLGFGHKDSGSVEPASVEQRLDEIFEHTRDALSGRKTGIAVYDGLARVAAETGLPSRYPFELIQGFAMDAQGRVYETFNDTLDYCYHVAGVVGVMMAIVMGVDPDDRATLERASDLGIAFQLSNIARDVMDDVRMSRCYLPDEWLTGAGIRLGHHARPEYRMLLAKVVARVLRHATRYEESARYGTTALPWRSAWAVLAAAGIYGDIGRKVRALGPRAWDERVTTSAASKLLWIAKTWPRARLRKLIWRKPPKRDGLWTMAP